MSSNWPGKCKLISITCTCTRSWGRCTGTSTARTSPKFIVSSGRIVSSAWCTATARFISYLFILYYLKYINYACLINMKNTEDKV